MTKVQWDNNHSIRRSCVFFSVKDNGYWDNKEGIYIKHLWEIVCIRNQNPGKQDRRRSEWTELNQKVAQIIKQWRGVHLNLDKWLAELWLHVNCDREKAYLNRVY